VQVRVELVVDLEPKHFASDVRSGLLEGRRSSCREGDAGNGDGLLRHTKLLLKVPRRIHVFDNVAAAHELAPHVELRKGRPAGELLHAVANRRIFENVHRLVARSEFVENSYDGRREAALRESTVSFHEKDHIVSADHVFKGRALAFTERHGLLCGTGTRASQGGSAGPSLCATA